MVYIRIFCIECRKDKNRDSYNFLSDKMKGANKKLPQSLQLDFFGKILGFTKKIVIQKI